MTRYHHHWFVLCVYYHENISKHIDVNHFKTIIGLMCLEKNHKSILKFEKSKDVEIYLIAETTVRAMEVMENQDVINLFFVHNLSNIKRNKNSLQILSNQVLNLSKCIGIMQRKGFDHQFALKLSHAKCIFLAKPYHNISRRRR